MLDKGPPLSAHVQSYEPQHPNPKDGAEQAPSIVLLSWFGCPAVLRGLEQEQCSARMHFRRKALTHKRQGRQQPRLLHPAQGTLGALARACDPESLQGIRSVKGWGVYAAYRILGKVNEGAEPIASINLRCYCRGLPY